MTSPTPRLGMELLEGPDNWDYEVLNANFVLLDDDLGGVVICTSITRPSATYPGMLAFETDTGLMILRNGDDSGWILSTTAVTCTSVTRPTDTHAGMLAYETDTSHLIMRNAANTAWNVRMNGQTTYQTGNDTTTVSTASYSNGTGGTMPGATFVAPPSGEVLLHYSAQLTPSNASTNATTYYAPYVKTGGSIDSGSDVVVPSDNDAVRFGGLVAAVRFGASRIVPSLTPGSTYNVKMKGKIFSVTGGFSGDLNAKKLIIQPV